MRLAIPVKIAIRPGQVLSTPGRDLTCQPEREVNMPMSHFTDVSPSVPVFSIPTDFAVRCRFPGLPGEYCLSSAEHLQELAQDPVAFAADLAGLSRAQYLRRLAGDQP